MPSPAPTSASATPSQSSERSGSSATPARPPATRIAPAAAAVPTCAPRASGPAASVVAGSTDTSRAADAGDSPQTSITRITTRKSAPTSAPETRASAAFARQSPRPRGSDAAVASRAARQPATTATQRDGRLEGEDRAPVERLGQQPPDRGPQRRADRRGHAPAPHAERRQRAREQERAAERLDYAQRDEQLERPGEAQPAEPAANRISPPCRHDARARPAHEPDHERRRDHDGDVVDRDHERDAADRGVELAQQVGQREHDDRRVREGERDRRPDGGLADRQRSQLAHGGQPAMAIVTDEAETAPTDTSPRPFVRHPRRARRLRSWHGTSPGDHRVPRAAGRPRAAARPDRARDLGRPAVARVVASAALVPARAHARRACAAQPGARRPDRVGRSLDRARARRPWRRSRDPCLGRVPLSRLRRLRQGAVRAVRARRAVARATSCSSTGPTTRARRPTICRCAPCRATTATTGRACWWRSRPRGRLLGARGSAHLGWNGSDPWWDEHRDNWAPYGGVAYRAAGSHAVGLRRGDLDLAGDGWNGDLAVVPAGSCDLRAADRAGRRARPFDPGAVAPWDKGAWSDPGIAHTGPPGSSPGAAAEARAPGASASWRPGSASRSRASARCRGDLLAAPGAVRVRWLMSPTPERRSFRYLRDRERAR